MGDALLLCFGCAEGSASSLMMVMVHFFYHNSLFMYASIFDLIKLPERREERGNRRDRRNGRGQGDEKEDRGEVNIRSNVKEILVSDFKNFISLIQDKRTYLCISSSKFESILVVTSI